MVNPDRVRHARMYYGWSQAELAALVGTTQPKLSQLEKGLYSSSELVDAIAQATQYSREWFDLGPLPDLPTGSLRFRKQASSRVRDDERIRCHVRQAIEILAKFSDLPESPPVQLRPLYPSEALSTARIEQVALEVREQLGVGPSDAIPNLVRAIERCGVVVIGSAVDIEKHSGASFWPDYPHGHPIICISRGVSGDRQRFTAGHELGHLLLHQFGNPDPKTAESEANRFASALLIPRDAALEWIEPPITLRKLALVKAQWGISIRALVRRSLDLHLIDDANRLSLEKQIASRGWSKQEPIDVPYEQPALLRRLIEIGSGLPAAERGRLPNLLLPPLATRDLVA